MAKGEPRETQARPGPVRTSSGTRVAAVRVEPLEDEVASRKGANDVERPPPRARDAREAREEMPTRELDVEQLRAMALRCASDVGIPESGPAPAPAPATPTPARPRLELVFGDEASGAAAGRPIVASDDEQAVEHPRPRRAGRLLLLLLLLALPLAAVLASRTYGLLP